MAVYDQYDKQQIADEYHKSYYAISLYSPENLPELKNKLENAENSSKYLIGQMVNNASEMDTPVHADPIAQFFIDHPGISLSKSARMLGIPRTTLKRKYDVLVSTGLISVIP